MICIADCIVRNYKLQRNTLAAVAIRDVTYNYTDLYVIQASPHKVLELKPLRG